MKVRNGFVSNSSSSSFILLGANVDKVNDYKSFDGMSVDKWEISTLYIEEHYEQIIGIVLADDNEYLDFGILKYDKITELSTKLSHKLSIPIEEIELIYGTRPS